MSKHVINIIFVINFFGVRILIYYNDFCSNLNLNKLTDDLNYFINLMRNANSQKNFTYGIYHNYTNNVFLKHFIFEYYLPTMVSHLKVKARIYVFENY